MSDVLARDPEGNLLFHCPGCKCGHKVWVATKNPKTGAIWNWDGSTDRPTFTPSILVEPNDRSKRCHFYVRDGMIAFLSDSFHDMKGQTVPIPPLES